MLKCFSKPLSSPEQEKAGKGVIPGNTDASTQCALRNFNEWASNHYSSAPDNPVPKDLLASRDVDLVYKWLYRFLMETRKSVSTVITEIFDMWCKSRFTVVSREAKKKQHARASSGLRDHYSELFTWMAALKF